jgi:hypothetical protein
LAQQSENATTPRRARSAARDQVLDHGVRSQLRQAGGDQTETRHSSAALRRLDAAQEAVRRGEDGADEHQVEVTATDGRVEAAQVGGHQAVHDPGRHPEEADEHQSARDGRRVVDRRAGRQEQDRHHPERQLGDAGEQAGPGLAAELQVPPDALADDGGPHAEVPGHDRSARAHAPAAW